MKRRTSIFGLGAVGVAGLFASPVYARYRREIRAARDRLDHLGSHLVETNCGPIEYAERGAGCPVLVIHGIFGGFDQGLVDAGDTFSDGYRLIVPSRFGYLRTPMPPGASSASQADAHACLLDRLSVERVVVVGYSAGATSAIQFVLRYPQRVAALVLISPNAPGATAASVSPPKQVMSLLFKTDLLVWLALAYFASALQSTMGVPKGLKLTTENEAQVVAMMRTVLPTKPRGEGFLFDMYVSNPDINSGFPLERIFAPTLVVSAKDDTLASYEDAKSLAMSIPSARLLTVENGGHMLLGQKDVVDSEIRAFLSAQLRERVEGLPELAGVAT